MTHSNPAHIHSSPAPVSGLPAGVNGWLICLVLGVSLVAGLAFSWPLLRNFDLDGRTTACVIAVGGAPWVFLAILIICLTHLVPIEHRNWKRALPIHLFACLAISLSASAVSKAMMEGQLGDHPRAGSGWPRGSWAERRPPPGDSNAGSHEFFDRDSPGGSSGVAEVTPRAPDLRFGRHHVSLGKPDTWAIAKFLLSRSLDSGLVVLIYFLLIAATQAVRNHRRATETERIAELSAQQLDHARLQALQNQLQPHFLFNTLNAVTSFIYERPRVAEEMLCSLSTLLRGVLDLSHRNEVSLAEELELADLYLDIQRHRFGARLQVIRTVDQLLLGVAVPPLVLQPIVENAIVHGVDGTDQSARIEIRIEAVNSRLRLTVIDHHSSVSVDLNDPPKRRGVGLTNIQDRLRTLYPNQAELHANPRAEGGFLTEVNMPLQPYTAIP